MADEDKTFNSNIIFERRKFVRVGGTFVVSYSDISAYEQKSDISQTKNISLGGLLFTADREFPVNAILRLRLRLPKSLGYINLKVQVVASVKKGKGVFYETRVRFIGLSEEDKEAVRHIVEYNLENQ